MGHRDAARRDFEDEASRFPLDARPFNNLAALYLLAGDTSGAQAAIDSGLVRDSTLDLLYLQRLAIAEAHADTAIMRQVLERARELSGDLPVWSYWQGELDRLSGSGESARGAYRASFRQVNTAWPSIDTDASGYRGPSQEQLDYRIGLTYVAEGQLDSAEYHFRAAALADSGFAEAWSNWGTAALNRSEPAIAIERYRISLAGNPATPVVWTNLAIAFLQAGFPDSAHVALGAALDIAPDFTPAATLLRHLDSLAPRQP
jgi:tetratricopeptide (TPR) repeat protein